MTELAFSKPDPSSVIRHKAMDLLARREHSRLELKQKLSQRFPDQGTLIDVVLSRLADENLQSDSRYAEAFLAARSGRGQGPQRIRAELRQRGVSDVHVDQVMQQADIDWHALARQVVARKYGEKPCSDYSERAKRSRFLQYRGFDSDVIKAILSD